MEKVKVAEIGDLDDNEAMAVEAGGKELALYRVCGRFYASDDICSHAYSKLSEGWLDDEDCAIECALHGSKFNLETGKPMSLPATKPIRVYNVVVEGNSVYVEI